MNPRTGVKLAIWVLSVLAAAILAAAIAVTVHTSNCSFDESGAAYGWCGSDPTLYAAKAFGYLTGGALGVSALGLAIYLKQTGPNPAR